MRDLRSGETRRERYDALVHFDDCHATGFLGKGGRGTHEYRGCMDRVDIITGTLGKALGGASGISKSAVSRICQGLDEQVKAFLGRPLDHARFPYVYLDATYLHGRDPARRQVISRAVIVAVGITGTGQREVLGIEVGDSEDILDVANKAPIIKLVNMVLFQALKMRVSDVHFQPFEDRLQIRYRIDGVLSGDSLEQSMEGDDIFAGAAEEMIDEFFDAAITIKLPGEVVSHNADEVRGDGTLVWNVGVTDDRVRIEGRPLKVVSEFEPAGDQPKAIAELAGRVGAMVLVDEAHSLGVFGERGCGVAEEQGVTRDRVLLSVGPLPDVDAEGPDAERVAVAVVVPVA